MLTILLFALAAHADTTLGNGTTAPDPGPVASPESPTNPGVMDFTNPNAPTYIPPGSTVAQPSNGEPLMGAGISLSPTLPGNPTNSAGAVGQPGIVPGAAPDTTRPPGDLPNPNRGTGLPTGAGGVNAGGVATPGLGGTGGASSSGSGNTGGVSTGGTGGAH